MGKTIGIIAIKGGVGKTTVALNLGAVLAKDFGQKVLLIDTNFSAPNLGLHLGIVKPDKTIQDVLKERCSMKDAIINHEHGFDLVLGSLHEWRMKQPHKLKQKLEPMKQWYDYIILDSSPNLNDEIFATIMASDDLLIVTSPDHPTLSCTLHATKVAKKRGTPVRGLILNKTYGKDFELTTEEIEDAAGAPVLAELPADLRVMESLAHTTPSTLRGPMHELSVRYKHLAAQLLGKEYKDPRMSTKVKNFFGALMGKKRR